MADERTFVMLKIMMRFIFFMGMYTACAQNFMWQKDSLLIDSIYNVAVTFSNSDPERAETELEKLIAIVDDSLLEKHPEKRYLRKRKAVSKHFLAYYKRRKSSFDESLELYLEAIDLKKRINDTLSIATSLNQLGFLWMYQEQYSKAETYFLEALQLSERYKTTTESISILSNLGTVYLYSDQRKKAQKSHERAVFLADSIQHTNLIASTSANYAVLLRKLEKYQENIPYVNKAIAIYKETNNQIGLESGYFALGASYRKMKQPAMAIYFFEKAIELSLKLNNKALLPSRYLGISNAYEDAGNMQKALEYFRKYEKALRARNDQAEIRKMADLEAAYKYKQQKLVDSLQAVQEKRLQKQQIEAQSKQQLTLIILIATFVIFLILVAYLFVRQKKLVAEKKVLEKEKENFKLSKEVHSKENQVKELLGETVKHIQDKEVIAENLKKVIKEEDGISLQSILVDLKVAELEDNKRQIYKEKILQSDPDFIERLRKTYPKLTKTDIEICCYERAGLTRREISNLRQTTIEAVKSNRYRLKKKLGIPADVSLSETIRAI